MVPLRDNFRILSQPAEVWWAGFRSTTYELQQHGWKIAASEDLMRHRIALILRHDGLELYAFTRSIEFIHQRDFDSYHRGAPLVFEVRGAATNPQWREIRLESPMSTYRQIDAMPQIVASEIKSMDDFKIFATPLVRTEEIIVEPQTVAAMLEQIRRMQAPEQARIRARERAADRRDVLEAVPRQTFHAQIISVEDYKKAA